MTLTYLKIAIRNFLRTKTYSIVNLVGVAIGLASVMIILSYVQYELSYDKHYTNAERIYRLTQVETNGTERKESVFLPSGLATVIKEEFPEVDEATYPMNQPFGLAHHNEVIGLAGVHADSTFFRVFNFRFKYGNAVSALKSEHDIVLTEKIADRFFPGRNPLGEEIISKYGDEEKKYIITGVIENIPSNTHFSADVITGLNKAEKLSWRSYFSQIQYLLLKSGSDFKSLEKKLPSIYAKYDFPDDVAIKLQPVPSIHLHSHIEDEPNVNGDIRHVYIFSLIAVLILFIASVNYINLTTARSLQRVKEVGVRKVLGADRKQLCLQFVGESFLFFCTAIPFAVIIAHISWPAFINILKLTVDRSYLLSAEHVILLSTIAIVAGVLSGLYPALFLAHLQPALILKDHHKSFRINMSVRKTLIVLQFIISVALIISTIVIRSQLHYINTKPLGFNKNNLIVIPRHQFEKHAGAFKNKLKENSSIESVSIVSWNVGDRFGARSSMDDPKDSTRELTFNFVDGDFDFLATLQIPLLEGRSFSTAYPADVVDIDSLLFPKDPAKKPSREAYGRILASRPIIISEKTAWQLELKKPVGTVLSLGGLQGTVIGVVRDFNGLSLHHETVPVVLRGEPEKERGLTYVRIRSENMARTLNYIENAWKSFFPSSKFNFSFVDERLQQLYDSERRLSYLFTVFAVLAICIASSGLFSLVALTIQQRTKEIGIRKVLGAGVPEIVKLVTKDFVLLITIAIVIASPAAWYAMNKWLEQFAFRINISWWIFFLAAFLAIGIALITISVQAIRAAMANPADSLRTE
jgi:putative ABC transport system permease protein